MSAVITLPAIPTGMTEAKIYSSDGATDTLIDTIPATSIEWESSTEPISSIIKVSFTDGITETELTTVQTFEQALVQFIRDVEGIPDTEISDAKINALIPAAKAEIKIDICMYLYKQPVTQLQDVYYKIPNKFYFDENLGGSISPLDVDFYAMEVPSYEWTTKEPVTPIKIDLKEMYIELDTAIPATKKMYVDFYYTHRRFDGYNKLLLVGSKIAELQAADDYTSASTSSAADAASTKIGDITIKSSSSSGSGSTSALKNTWIQRSSRYKHLVYNFKRGFYRVT